MIKFRICADFLSPLCQISDDVGDVVLIHGEDDRIVNPEHSRIFYDRMTELGRKCELHLIERTDHAFLLAEYYKSSLAACKIAMEIIDEVTVQTPHY